MKPLLKELLARTGAGEHVVVSTIVESVGSSPRELGASMALTGNGDVFGSLSGGCLESDVLGLAAEVMSDGLARTASYGPEDSDDLFAVGLTCGGYIKVLVRRFSPEHAEALHQLDVWITQGLDVMVASRMDTMEGPTDFLATDGETSIGSLGSAGLDEVVQRQAPSLLRSGWTGILRLGSDGRRDETDVPIVVESFRPRPRLLIVGAIDAAGALAQMAQALGYHVTLADHRPIFATTRRFPSADCILAQRPSEVLASWNADERSAICVLSHDSRIDVPYVVAGLRSPAFYVGAMGSRKTHLDRLDRLSRAGATAGELSRLHSPIGLAIGARTPGEIAAAIIAELVSEATKQDPTTDVRTQSVPAGLSSANT
ncbi:XdhC family protein [Rhodococcus opacus]|uniref:XshC-Cox1 family protein n=1 Tax=Rhodococcus opacus TaxID=37919 RepID=A0A2S8IYY7_RHOOP|nr:XdhC/CoxI family protein [Rhodococcus opacus]PQP20010.1 XshC-Cox1 family protein [Rhodococcus opacus]